MIGATFGLLDSSQTLEYALPGRPQVNWDPAPVIATSPTGSQRVALERSFSWTFPPSQPFTRAQYDLLRGLRASDGTIYLRTKDEDGAAVVWKAKTDARWGAVELHGFLYGVTMRFWMATKV
jgi:hypothetical protein